MLPKIASVACNQPLGIACDGEFHEVIVCLILKVWSPPIIYPRQLTLRFQYF
jgi:hypothetical protein